MPVPHRPLSKEFLKPFLLVLSLPDSVKSWSLFVLISFPQVLEGRSEVSLEPSLQAIQTQLLLFSSLSSAALCASLWFSSGPTPTGPCFSCAEGLNLGHRSFDAAQDREMFRVEWGPGKPGVFLAVISYSSTE